MHTGLRLTFRRGDLLAIFLVVLMAVCVFIACMQWTVPDKNRIVQVYQDGALIRELPLDSDASFGVSGQYANTICIKNGRAAIIDSDCPGADCVHSGWTDRSGRSIVCLPNRVEIRITGASDVDFVVG